MKTKIISFPKTKIILFISYLVIISIVPVFLHTQWLTGPLVNGLLILTLLTVGLSEALVLSLIPSTVALSAGLLPLPLAPMVPFIIISNAIFVLGFYYLKPINNYFALITSAFLKFIFLFLTVQFLMSTMLSDKLIGKLSIMMSWPQFITAIVGGLIAFAIIKTTKK